MSAWQRVFLRNGLIWPPYILASNFLLSSYLEKGRFGPSELMFNVVIAPVWILMAGGGMCVFRPMVQWITTEAAEKGKKMPAMRWRWLWSFFLEVDKDYRLRP